MITISTEALKRAVSVAGNSVEPRPTLPILGHLLCDLDSETQTLRLTGTNLELTLSTAIEIQADPTDANPPRFTLPYDKLKAILSSARAEQLRLSVGEHRATLAAGSARFQLATLPHEDFPEPPSHKRESIAIRGQTLRTALAAVTPAAAINDARFFLNGVYCEHDGSSMALVATDGHRIHVATLPHESATTPAAILPRNTAIALTRLIPDQEIHLHFGQADMAADLGDLRVHTKLVDGRYPDWRGVFPTGHRATATCNALELKQALAGCAVLSNEIYRGIRMSFDNEHEEPEIKISATNAAEEHSDDRVRARIDGEPLENGFCADYLVRALECIPCGDAEIRFTDNGAAVIRAADAPDEIDVCGAVMAMRL